MAHIVLSNSSSVVSNFDSTTPNNDDVISMARVLYQRLGSLEYNKHIKRVEEPTDYFNKIINMLDDYSRLEGTDEFKLKTTMIAQLDEYLGELGMTQFYPFQGDWQQLPLWIDVTLPAEIRNVSIYDIDGNKTDNVVVGSDNVVLIYKDL